MLLVRIIALATALALSAMILSWLFTGDRVWLRRSWLLFRIALVVIVTILLLFLAEAAFAG